MYALRLEPDFINNLTPEGRRWLERAVVNMINIDGKLDPNEMPYMHDAVILIDESERAELLEMRNKETTWNCPISPQTENMLVSFSIILHPS